MHHTAATNAAHAGLDAATIPTIGGWKSRQMAERCTHAANLTTAMDALGSRFCLTQLHQNYTRLRATPLKPA